MARTKNVKSSKKQTKNECGRDGSKCNKKSSSTRTSSTKDCN